MRQYTKIVFLQIILGGIVLFLRFNVDIHLIIKTDTCDLDPTSE